MILEEWDDDELIPTYEDDGMDEGGCVFPGHCVMPGYHLKSECATADMMQAMMLDEGEPE